MGSIPLAIPRRVLLVQGIGVILLASIMFGAMAVCVGLATREMAAPQVALARFVGSLVLLLALTRGRGLRSQGASVTRLFLRGLLGAGAIVLYYLGITGAGAGLATLVQCTYPVSTALVAATFMGERFTGRLAAALVLNLVGVAVVLGGAVQLGHHALIGGLTALGASLLSGGAVATARSLRSTESAAVITTYFMAVGAIVTAPTLFAGLPPFSPGLVMALGGVVVTSVAGQWLLHHGLGFASATQGSLTAATSVLTAATLEAVLLGHHLPRQALFGACFMIAAIALAAGHE